MSWRRGPGGSSVERLQFVDWRAGLSEKIIGGGGRNLLHLW